MKSWEMVPRSAMTVNTAVSINVTRLFTLSRFSRRLMTALLIDILLSPRGKLEERTELQEEKIKVANHRIGDLEKKNG